jgi:hypothetical protein
MTTHPNRGRKLAVVTGNAPFRVVSDDHYLAGHSWTRDRDQATIFTTWEAARDAIRAAALFNKAAIRAATIAGEI